MQTHEIQKRICDAVRNCIPSDREIAFEFGVVTRNEVRSFCLVIARIPGDHLAPFDCEQLLSLIDGTIREANDRLLLIDGEIAGSRYELRFCAEPVSTTGV